MQDESAFRCVSSSGGKDYSLGTRIILAETFAANLCLQQANIRRWNFCAVSGEKCGSALSVLAWIFSRLMMSLGMFSASLFLFR